MSKTTAKKASITNVPELKPKDPDIKYLGDEPLFAVQPDPDQRGLGRAFGWYNRYYGRKDAKQLFAQWLDVNDRPKEAKLIRTVDEKEFFTSICFLSRMSVRGLQLTEHEALALETEVSRLLHTLAKPTGATLPEEAEEEVKAPNRPNIQEVMLEKAREMGGELEGLLDEYMMLGSQSKHNIRPIDTIIKANVLAHHIKVIVDQWSARIKEIEEAAKGDDEQLVEGYAHLSKAQMKNLVKFCELVINDLNGYNNIKKAAKAPRVKKAVPITKIVAKLKYLKEFDELKLKSIEPTKVHGASEVWLYDTSKRKVTYYVADSFAQTLSVKGNTLLGFDKAQSMTKTLRKPADQLKELLKAGKPAARKWLKDVKTVSTEPNGRFNDNIIILKAY